MATATGERARGALLLALVLGLLGAGSASAADVSLTAEVDRTEIGLDETVLLQVRLQTPTAPTQWGQFPSTPDFKVLVEAPSQEQSFSLGGGSGMVVRRILVITRQLQPTRTGALTIPAVTAVVQGRKYATQPMVVNVHAAGAQGPGPGYRGWEKDLTVQVEVDRKEAYLGEQITAAFWLLTRAEEVAWNTTEPRYDGFWKEQLEQRRMPTQPESRTVNGIQTRAFLLERVALFPTRAGDLTIDPLEVQVQLRLGSQGLFSGFDDVVRATRRTGPVTVRVKPLPRGAPPGFDASNVGRLTLAGTATPPQVAVGEPITVRMSVSGDGNARLLSPPNLPPFPGVRAFQPTTHEQIEQRDQRLFGTRTVETVLVPQQEGELVIAPEDWPYFDPRAGKYQVIRTPELKVTVVPAGPGASSPAAAPGSNALETQIRGIRSNAALSRRGPPAWERPWFLALLLLPPLAFLSLAAVGRLRASGDGTRAQRTAARSARRRIAAARRRLGRGDSGGAFAEIERALLGYASDRLGRAAAGLTRVELAAELAKAGAHPPAMRALLRALDLVESSRYGAGGAQGEEVLAAAERAVEALEEADWQPDVEVA